jgi:hypothetical protein
VTLEIRPEATELSVSDGRTFVPYVQNYLRDIFWIDTMQLSMKPVQQIARQMLKTSSGSPTILMQDRVTPIRFY